MDIGGGKMTKIEADIKAKEIFEEISKECDEIMEKAKAEGQWRPGLDSNNYLFKEVHERGRKRLEELAAMIDE